MKIRQYEMIHVNFFQTMAYDRNFDHDFFSFFVGVLFLKQSLKKHLQVKKMRPITAHITTKRNEMTSSE